MKETNNFDANRFYYCLCKGTLKEQIYECKRLII